jgi:putative ABC transport system ATP-binding protein
MEILKVENLSKIYGKGNNKVAALDNVSFSVDKGEFVSIVGSSGSGKSTLLHILGAVLKPTSGKIYVNNVDVYSKNSMNLAKYRREEACLVYQFYNLIPILSVKENITLPVLLDKKKIDNDYLNELIETVGLKSRITHLPNELSGGEQQRVAIARGLLPKPSLLLLDEPTGNLDSKTKDEIMNLLKISNKKYNQTIIMITHDLSLASKTDRIITIKDGKIISDTKC